MKNFGRLLLAFDALINLFLGIVLLFYSDKIIDLFGLPYSDQKFYPNILGAVLFGIGIALLIEFSERKSLSGLGLAGAISINISGGLALFFYLLCGQLEIPIHGKIILWVLDVLLLGISIFEITALFKNYYKKYN